MKTFNLEEGLRAGAGHLEALVDTRGRTYFDVFRTEPAEAVTDWPDFVDLPARYLEAAALVEPVIGRPIRTAPALRQRLFSCIEADGLAYRPASAISEHVADLFDQSRLLYALTTWAMHAPDDREVRDRLRGLVEGLHARATCVEDYAYIGRIGIYFGGTLIRPLVQAGLVLREPAWVDFGGHLARGIVDHSTLYAEDGSFAGHVHGPLGTLAGILAYALVRGDDRLVRRAIASFEYARSISTAFGFVPELAQRDDDLIACETCTLMDYLDVALLLARHVDARYWEVVERATRNHLVESQIGDQHWLADGPDPGPEDGVIRGDLTARLRGAFAGWSAPHCLLAYEEHLDRRWVQSPALAGRYLGKVRALQNCCAAAGIRALHGVWRNIVTRAGDRLDVNLLIDKQTPEVRIVGYAPSEGRARIEVRRDCALRVRVPAATDVTFRTIAARAADEGGVPLVPRPDGPCFDLGPVCAGATIEVVYAQPERREHVVIGNQGRQQYAFDVTWRGETVMALVPDAANVRHGYSRVVETEVRLFYDESGPGRLYQRQAYRLGDGRPESSETVVDKSGVDWHSLHGQGGGRG